MPLPGLKRPPQPGDRVIFTYLDLNGKRHGGAGIFRYSSSNEAGDFWWNVQGDDGPEYGIHPALGDTIHIVERFHE